MPFQQSPGHVAVAVAAASVVVLGLEGAQCTDQVEQVALAVASAVVLGLEGAQCMAQVERAAAAMVEAVVLEAVRCMAPAEQVDSVLVVPAEQVVLVLVLVLVLVADLVQVGPEPVAQA